MPITYTNRKGVTYHLCQGVTKTGKPRYYFARQPKGEPVPEIPQGWRISESVNGVVSLVRDRPSQILPEEFAAVEAALERHPKTRNYRAVVKRDRIEVYERIGLDADDLVAVLSKALDVPNLADRLHDWQDQRGRFAPVLRFVLADAAQRTFDVQRMCYRGSSEGWIYVGASGPVDQLARSLIPTLGTERFFELY